MPDHELHTYPPLNTLKAVASDVWVVDGPVIRFGPPLLKFPFSTRMTVIRVGDDLMIYSPTPLSAELEAEVLARGTPRWIVAPNRIHYWWVGEWLTAFPDAQAWLAPRVAAQASGHFSLGGHSLDGREGYPWDGVIDTLPIPGRYMSETVVFHRPSRTLVVADLIENFEATRLSSRSLCALANLGAVLDPHGSMPRDMRLSYPRAALKAAVRTMIDWDPERIVLAHGRWYERNGAAELRRAFAWLLRP